MIIKHEGKLFYSISEIKQAASIASGDDGRMAKKIEDVLQAFMDELESAYRDEERNAGMSQYDD